jgi:hypothetical protein
MELKLNRNHVLHKMWIEPENFPTCIVVKPYPKEYLSEYFIKSVKFVLPCSTRNIHTIQYKNASEGGGDGPSQQERILYRNQKVRLGQEREKDSNFKDQEKK